ncbi:MAG: hypothetical protein AB1921_09030, partial [Thermodesulfobacteriota bacterium]
MKKLLVLMLLIPILAPCSLRGEEAPLNLAGFTLGQDVSKFRDRLDMTTALPVRYLESLKEVEIGKLPGYKSGLIAYSTCTSPQKVVRIKLKYADSGEDFFNKLFSQLKNRFGEPDKFRGDSFGIMTSWKWSFTDAQGHNLSLVISHNTMDVDEKMGNAIKLTDLT